MVVWHGEQLGEFSVCSSYKLLQEGTIHPSLINLKIDSKATYMKLWNLKLPTKIRITIWRIVNGLIPTFLNLNTRRLVTNVGCTCCSHDLESLVHVFRDYLVSMEIWNSLNLQWILSKPDLEFLD